jgi:hypothetical protein
MQVMGYMNHIIEGKGALVSEAEDKQPLITGDIALVDPDEKYQYRKKENTSVLLKKVQKHRDMPGGYQYSFCFLY